MLIPQKVEYGKLGKYQDNFDMNKNFSIAQHFKIAPDALTKITKQPSQQQQQVLATRSLQID